MTFLHAPPPLCFDIMDVLALGVVIVDGDERIVMWNRWMEEASGWHRDAVTGTAFTAVFPELSDHRVYHAICDALRLGHPAVISQSLHRSPFPLTRGRRDGRIEQSVQISPFFSNGSRYCLIQINDVTFALERERVLRRQTIELREAQQQQLALLNGIAEMAWLKDDAGRYLAVNQNFAMAMGTSVEEVVGYTDLDLYDSKVAERYTTEDRDVMETAKVKRMEDLEHPGTEQERWIEKIVAPVIGPTGNVIGTAGTARDITERKLAETQIQRLNVDLERRVHMRTAELERSNEALLHSNMELRRFAHAAAHDLQTPLRSIASFAQLIQKQLAGELDGDPNEWLNLVIDSTRRLRTLINELLAYSRLDGEMRPFEPTDLQQIFQEVLTVLSAPISETAAEVQCGPLPTVQADRNQMVQLFQNLIENGIKYNTTKPPRVSISCAQSEKEWIFTVQDNGIGIPPEHHQRIFEIFRRLHSYKEIPGTGIGLAICQRIIERHSGRIWVESGVAEGSRFYFTLPL